MSSLYGENIKLSLFGESHARAIGMTLDGIPAGKKIDMDALTHFLSRRSPGKSPLSSSRKEKDQPEFICGIKNNTTCGSPISAVIYNSDKHASDYQPYRNIPRPGHADYTAEIKYAGYQDKNGGGHFSGRLTAALCIAGGICIQLLNKEGIAVFSRVASIGKIRDHGVLSEDISHKTFPVVNDEQGVKMQKLILDQKAAGNSVGGAVECVITGCPPGLGDPIFDGIENRIAKIVFGIPAVKGLEFGSGFASSEKTGSENNDAFYFSETGIQTKTNHCGGILGGISNGMPIVFKVAFKPTPSISISQESVDMKKHEPTLISIQGRHDPCIVPRALPCVEAAAAIAIYDTFLGRKKEC